MAESSRTFEVTLSPRAVALTIAGSDPSGGAGLQADLKTFQQFGVYGMSVVTLLTVQNTQGVSRVDVLSPDLVQAQIKAVLDDIDAAAVKTGALGNARVVQAVGEMLQGAEVPIVVDPVMISKHGDSLVAEDVVEAYKTHLLPHATIVTPNRFEAEKLTGVKLNSEQNISEAVYRLREMGAQFVLIKLGKIDGKRVHLFGTPDKNFEFVVPNIDSQNTHGSGCILSAAITARLALGGVEFRDAVRFGIEKVYEAISVDTELGDGIHPAETRAMSRV